MKIKQLLLQLWPFIIGTALLTFIWDKEIIASLAFILIILIYLKQEYYKNEIFVLLFGIIIGALIELYGAYFVGFQIFQYRLSGGLRINLSQRLIINTDSRIHNTSFPVLWINRLILIPAGCRPNN